MATVLFVSESDTGYSPIASALFERAAAGRHRALSAGTRPGDRVDPLVVDVMRALGIDLSEQRPRPVTDKLVKQANVVVTIGDADECPYVPGRLYIEWDLDEPRSRSIQELREARDDIGWHADALVVELDWWVIHGDL